MHPQNIKKIYFGVGDINNRIVFLWLRISKFINQSIGLLKRLNLLLPDFLLGRIAESKDERYFYNIFWRQIKMAEHDSLIKKETQQVRRLKELLLRAQRHVPYYRELFKKIDFDAEHFHDLSEFKKIPILTRKILMEHREKLVSEDFSRSRLFSTRSSGSTGTPCQFYMEARQKYLSAAMWDMQYDMIGISPFSGKYIFSMPMNRSHIFRVDESGNISFNISLYDDAAMLQIFKIMKSMAYPVIIGIPSYLTLLARAARKHHIGFKQFKAMVGGYESTFPSQVEFLENTFRCPYFDNYGSVEGALYGLSCRYRRGLHVNLAVSYLEFEAGEVSGRPEMKKMIATPLYARAMPLIRYDTGDLVVIDSDSCVCGRTDPLLKNIAGRFTDVITTANGYVLGHTTLSYLLQRFEGIFEAQFQQLSPDEVIVNLVLDNTRHFHIWKFKKRLKYLLGENMKFTLNFLDHIPRTERGKFRFVDNKVAASTVG